ncbi:hypothetical protein PIB30_114731, partial [Stylosanthes scabra]|nr:hypothetical protein [Stylosanthes scabra]
MNAVKGNEVCPVEKKGLMYVKAFLNGKQIMAMIERKEESFRAQRRMLRVQGTTPNEGLPQTRDFGIYRRRTRGSIT